MRWHAAEEMAGETIERVRRELVRAVFSASRIIKAEIGITGRDESPMPKMRRVLEHGYLMREPGDRQIVHSVPVGFSVGRQPRHP